MEQKNLEKAVRLAIEGGWKQPYSDFKDENAYFLDPLFWQALGVPDGMIRFAKAITAGKSPEDFFKDLLEKEK